MTVLLTGAVGWRRTYFTCGMFGLGVGTATMFLITEPTRGLFEVKPQEVPKTESEVQAEEKAS